MKRIIFLRGFLSLIMLSTLGKLGHAKSININPLTTGLNSSYLGVEDAALSDQAFSNKRTPGRIFIYTTYHWDHEPWVILSKDKKQELEPVVSSMHTLDLGISWLLDDAMQLSFQTGASLVGVAPRFGSESTTHIGDSRLQFKYRFVTGTYWNMAVAPELTLPTGVEYVGHRYGASLSNSSFGTGLKLIGEFRTNQNQWTFNLGYSNYSQAEYKSKDKTYPRIDGRSRVLVGAGWLCKLGKNWALDTEASANMPTGENHFTPPGLFTVGGRYQPGKTISWHFGAGTGTFGAAGGNDPIIYAGLKIPFFGSSSANDDSAEGFEDPLVQEAYKKSLIDHAEDNSKMSTQDLEPLLNSNSNPVDSETGKALYTQDELTKKVIYRQERIQVLDEIEFDLNMSHLTPRGEQIVHQVARVILSHRDDIQHINVEGHTDHQGSDEVNNPLSQARAETVVRELISKGVPASLLTAQGFGSSRPLFNFRTVSRSQWSRNRRVDFKISQRD